MTISECKEILKNFFNGDLKIDASLHNVLLFLLESDSNDAKTTIKSIVDYYQLGNLFKEEKLSNKVKASLLTSHLRYTFIRSHAPLQLVNRDIDIRSISQVVAITNLNYFYILSAININNFTFEQNIFLALCCSLDEYIKEGTVTIAQLSRRLHLVLTSHVISIFGQTLSVDYFMDNKFVSAVLILFCVSASTIFEIDYNQEEYKSCIDVIFYEYMKKTEDLIYQIISKDEPLSYFLWGFGPMIKYINDVIVLKECQTFGNGHKRENFKNLIGFDFVKEFDEKDITLFEYIKHEDFLENKLNIRPDSNGYIEKINNNKDHILEILKANYGENYSIPDILDNITPSDYKYAGLIYQSTLHGSPDYKEAINCFELATTMGDSEAANLAANLYLYSPSNKNLISGFFLKMIAEKLGSSNANKFLKEVASSMNNEFYKNTLKTLKSKHNEATQEYDIKTKKNSTTLIMVLFCSIAAFIGFLVASIMVDIYFLIPTIMFAVIFIGTIIFANIISRKND